MFLFGVLEIIQIKGIKKGEVKMENTCKKEENKKENMCKKECKTYKKWVKGINKSLSPFAVKYFEFDCIDNDEKSGCLFETKGKKVLDMTKEQRETFTKMYQYYKIRRQRTVLCLRMKND